MPTKVYRRYVKLDEIIKLAAKELDVDPDLLKALAEHQFKFIKEWLKRPTSAMLQIYKFGFWVIKRNAFYLAFKNYVLDRFRKAPTEANKENLDYFIKFRHVISRYYSERKYAKRDYDGKLGYFKVKIGKIDNGNNISGESKSTDI